MSLQKNIIFFGEDAFSLVVLQSLLTAGHNAVAVVMLQPITISGQRLVKYCAEMGIPIVETKSVRSDDFVAQMDQVDFDILISAHFQRIIPSCVYKKSKIIALNLHPSLLPRYRGMSPQHWPIAKGDSETGVTVHVLEDEVDTGNIIHQVKIPIGPSIYIHELQKKLLDVYKSVVVDAVESFLNGNCGIAQSKDKESYFHKIQDADMVIRQTMCVVEAYGLIRAFSYPYQGAIFDNIRIMRAEPSALLPIGRKDFVGIDDVSGKKVLFLKDGALEITKWKHL